MTRLLQLAAAALEQLQSHTAETSILTTSVPLAESKKQTACRAPCKREVPWAEPKKYAACSNPRRNNSAPGQEVVKVVTDAEASEKRARKANAYIANHQREAVTATAAARKRPATASSNVPAASGSENSETMLYGFLLQMILKLDPERLAQLAQMCLRAC